MQHHTKVLQYWVTFIWCKKFFPANKFCLDFLIRHLTMCVGSDKWAEVISLFTHIQRNKHT